MLGRTFSVRALRAVHPVAADRERLDDVLVELCDAGMLAPHLDGSGETQYAFRHALACEAIYSLMLFAQRRELHQTVAEWLESEPNASAALLAHHWESAEVWSRAAPALAAAGAEGVHNSASREAVYFLRRALEIDRREGLGHTALERGRWQARIQDAWYAAGRLDEARDAALEALTTLGHPMPMGVAGGALAFFTSAATRVAQSVLLPLFRSRSSDQKVRLRESAHLYLQLLEIFFYQNDPNRGLVAGFRSINLAERLDPGAEFARGFSMMAAVMDLFLLPSVGDRWGARALAAAEAEGDRSTLAYTLSRVGVRSLTKADWTAAEASLVRGLELSAELGERRLWEENASILGKALQFQGRFAEAEARWREVTTAAVERDAPQIVAWGQLSVAWNLIWQGRPDEARVYMAPELERGGASEVDHDVLWAHALHALASAEAGDDDGARDSVALALPRMSITQPYPYFMLPAVAAVCIVTLRRLERQDGELPALRKDAKKAFQSLQAIARVFPFARPMMHLVKGSLNHLLGKDGTKHWTRAIAQSEELGMPFEGALARLESGRRMPPGQARTKQLEKAAEAFEALGALTLVDRAVAP